MTAAGSSAGAGPTTAAAEVVAVEVEAVLRDRLDYGTSGRLIADFGETAVTLADAIAAALAAAGLLADPTATDTTYREQAEALIADLRARVSHYEEALLVAVRRETPEPDFRPAIINGLEARFRAVLTACELAEAEARHVVDDEVYVSVGLIRNALRTSAVRDITEGESDD